MPREKNKKRKSQISDEERLAKIKKKTENNKEKEKAMWKKLVELNKKFKNIKKHERAGEKKSLLRLFNRNWICSRVNKDIHLFLLTLDRSGKKKLLFETQNPHLSRASNDGLSIIVDFGQVRNKSLGSNVYIINVFNFFLFLIIYL